MKYEHVSPTEKDKNVSLQSEGKRRKDRVVPVHATKANGGSRDTTPLFLNLGTRRRWVVNLIYRPLYSRERIPVPTEQEAEWPPELVWRVLKKRKYLEPPVFKTRTLTLKNPELNPICYLLALLAHHFLHVSRIMVKSLPLRLLMSYIYRAPILDVSRSHTTTQHSR